MSGLRGGHVLTYLHLSAVENGLSGSLATMSMQVYSDSVCNDLQGFSSP